METKETQPVVAAPKYVCTYCGHINDWGKRASRPDPTCGKCDYPHRCVELGLPSSVSDWRQQQRESFAKGNLDIDRQPDSRRTVPAPAKSAPEIPMPKGQEVLPREEGGVVNPVMDRKRAVPVSTGGGAAPASRTAVHGHPELEYDNSVVGAVVKGTSIGALGIMQLVRSGIDPRASYPSLTSSQIEAVKAYAAECEAEGSEAAPASEQPNPTPESVLRRLLSLRPALLVPPNRGSEQRWNTVITDLLYDAEAALEQPSIASQLLPTINVRLETVSPDLTGTTHLNVVRVEQEDDGSFTAVSDYWPSQPARDEGLAISSLLSLVNEFVEWCDTTTKCGYWRDKFREAVLAAKSDTPGREWISVTERMPERLGMEVLVCDNSGRRHDAKYDIIFDDQPPVFIANCVSVQNVTHWMPMPDPPVVALAAKAEGGA